MGKDPLGLFITRGFRRDLEIARYAEKKGFQELWIADVLLERDSVTTIAAYAATMEKIVLGTGICPMWARNPAILAVTAGSLWELAPGRIKFGLGAWWEPLASKVGVHRRKNLKVMKEIVTNMRKLLNLEMVTFQGEHVNFTELNMAYLTKEAEKRPVPIYVGATGLKMCEVAGEVGDGAVLNYMVSPDYIRQCVEHIKIGAERKGRKLEDLQRPQLLAVSMSEDREKAMDAGKVMLTEYLGREPHIMKASGVSQDLIDQVQKIAKYPYTHEQVVKASKLVPEEAVQKILAAGTPNECRRKVAEYIKAGSTLPAIYPVLGNYREVIDEFASGYL